MRDRLIVPILMMYALVWLLSGCFLVEEPEASSGTVAAPTLAVAAPTVEASEPAPTETPAPTDVPVEAPTDVPVEEATAEPVEEPTAEPVEEPTGEAVQEPQPTGEAAEEPLGDVPPGLTIYTIDPAQSEARFTIEEVLRGEDTTVVGVSQNLGGQLAFDLADPSATQVGEILINARDFVTDNDFRNRAIQNNILETDDYEFISFLPVDLVGLPESVTVGESYTFQIVGDLTLLDVTRSETFDVTVTVLSPTEIEGLASVTIAYADYGITIPLSTAVTAVEDVILLELDFVALAQ